MSRFAIGLSRIADRLKDAAAPLGTVSYQPITGPAIDITGKCWIGRTFYSRIQKESGASVQWGDRDYLINVSDLGIEPRRGDRITETVGDVSTVYELHDFFGEGSWRYSDPSKTIYRVHTKEVG